MGQRNEPAGMLSVLGPPAIVAIIALGLALIPSEVRTVLIAWTLLSIPVGVLFGHCVRNEN